MPENQHAEINAILYFIIPLAILLAGAFLWGFFWAIKKGQFDDLDTQAQRMLTTPTGEEETKTKTKNENQI
jgi:cbb3-type cytochrome oxidase maturation protein